MKVDLFAALKAMQNGNIEFFNSLTDAEVKSLPPFVLLLWMRSPQQQMDIRLEMTNEYVNPFVFSLGKHPRLLYQLFCAAQGGYGFTRLSYDKKKPIDPRVELVAEYKSVSMQKAADMVPRIPLDVLQQMARELGWTEKNIKDL